MIYAYIRISTNVQDRENQKYSILKFADENRKKKLVVDEWWEETISSRVKFENRQLSQLIKKVQKDDTLIVTELSRLGRSMTEIFHILHLLSEIPCNAFAIKEQWELSKNNIQNKIVAMCYSLVSELERSLISSRTKESLARLKSEGRKLGRPKGSNGKSKLDGKEDIIIDLRRNKKISKAGISRILSVSPTTLDSFIKTRNLKIE